MLEIQMYDTVWSKSFGGFAGGTLVFVPGTVGTLHSYLVGGLISGTLDLSPGTVGTLHTYPVGVPGRGTMGVALPGRPV